MGLVSEKNIRRDGQIKSVKEIIILSLTIIVFWASVVNAEVGVVIEGRDDEYPHYLNMIGTPMIEAGTTLVPVRAVADELGLETIWENNDSAIILKDSKTNIRMTVGLQQAQVNFKPVLMPLAPRIDAGLAMVPLRFLAESCGYYVNSSTAWNDNITRIYITPYTIIDDSEMTGVNKENFIFVSDNPSSAESFVKLKLRKGQTTPAGILLGSSIRDVLETYGVPRSPYRSLNYPVDWSGTLVYWGSFIPQSDRGVFWEFSFERGALSDLSVSF